MRISHERDFGHEDRERLYNYVESHGSATEQELKREFPDIDPSGLRHHVAILRRDGYLERDGDGELHAAFEEGVEEEHRDGELTFTVRPARQEDLAGIVGAIRQVAEEKTYIEAESVADVVDHEEVLLRHNEIEYRMFFVATVGKEVVGWVHLNAPEIEKLSHTAELTVGVLDEYRGHGIGSHLLERGLSWAAEHQLEKVYQSIPASNDDAIAFLDHHGWDTEAVREDHYKIGADYVDEVMMAIEI